MENKETALPGFSLCPLNLCGKISFATQSVYTFLFFSFLYLWLDLKSGVFKFALNLIGRLFKANFQMRKGKPNQSQSKNEAG